MADSDKKPDYFARTVSLVALLVSMVSAAISAYTTYLASVDRRYVGDLSVGKADLSLTYGPTKTAISVKELPLIFSNTGNRPISIQNVSYVVMKSDTLPPERECKKTVFYTSPIREYYDADTVPSIKPVGFAPFTIKPGENELRRYDFEGSVPNYQLDPNAFLALGPPAIKPWWLREEPWWLSACLIVESFTDATGVIKTRVPVGAVSVSGRTLPTSLTGSTIADKISIVNIRQNAF
jgi:hypothetical protein